MGAGGGVSAVAAAAVVAAAVVRGVPPLAISVSDARLLQAAASHIIPASFLYGASPPAGTDLPLRPPTSLIAGPV